MLQPFRRLLKPAVRIAGDLGFVALLANRCATATRELRVPGVTPAPDARSILALSPVRFGGDLKLLAASGRFRIFEMPEYWQYAMLSLYADASPERRDAVLRQFMTAYLGRLGIHAVIGAALWYRQDIPWGNAAEAVGVPYIIMHKECFKPQPGQMRRTVEKALAFGAFKGRHVIVHNEPIRDALVAGGYARADQVTALGCMRMDEFVRAARKAGAPRRERPLAVFFSFTLGVGLDDLHVDPFPKDERQGWYDLFMASHGAFARLAAKRPDADFVIKPKWRGQWTDLIDKAIAEAGIAPGSLPNLIVDSSSSAHQLIFDANVVATFNSTTMIEAGLAGRPVVIPDFAEAKRPVFSEHVKLRDRYDLFEVAETADAFMTRLEAQLDHPSVDPVGEQGRHALFEEWVSRLDAASSQRYFDQLIELTKHRAQMS